MIAAGTPLKVSLAATAASAILVLVVFELIRSRRLREQLSSPAARVNIQP